MPNNYESSEFLNQYLVFHYGSKIDQFPHSYSIKKYTNFPLRCVSDGPDYSSFVNKDRVLDLGCSVGRSSFELSKHFREVIGIDYSKSFINAAKNIKDFGFHEIDIVSEGKNLRSRVFLDKAIKREKVNFEVGDAQNLRKDLGTFDLVMACNLICRLNDPKKLLFKLKDLVKDQGQLFLTTPFTWLLESTKKENWLNYQKEDSFSALKEILSENFELIKSWEIPFLYREHSKKYQFVISIASRWVKIK